MAAVRITHDPSQVQGVVYAVGQASDGNVLIVGVTHEVLNETLRGGQTVLVDPPIALDGIRHVVIFAEPDKDALRKTYEQIIEQSKSGGGKITFSKA